MNDIENADDGRPYGEGDASYIAAGGEEGIRKLVDAFYDAMEVLPEARRILSMHSSDLTVTRDKLTRFLCGWLGGPKRYREKYGSIHIPRAHAHLDIGPEERDAWLACMTAALDKQGYPQSFKTYLLKALFTPADRSRTKD